MKTPTLLILLPFCSGLALAQPAFLVPVTGGDLTVAEGSWGCGVADYDGDGLVDIYIATGWGTTNRLYHNDGGLRFSRVTNEPDFAVGTDSGAGVWVDWDNDGDLDLFVSNYDPTPDFFFLNHPGDPNRPGRFRRLTGGAWLSDTGLGQGAAWGDYDRDGHVDLFVANTGDQNEFLYRNDGQGGMIPMVDGPVVRSAGRSQSGAWADYDGDGDLDLFVANSWDQRNYLFRNDGGTFASVTGSPWDNDRGNSIGAAWADYDNDGDLDLYIGNGNRVAFLYQNNGDGTFTRILEGPVATSSSVHIAPAWGDLDNDGYLDLFVGVGEGENDLLFHNQRDGTFTQIIEGEVVNDFLVGSGAAWTDFDNDGFLDLFVANDGMYDSGPPHRNEPDRLYHNQARANGNNNRWLLVQLIGTQSNRSAIGAKVRARSLLWSRDVWQLREISGGGGHCSQNDLRAHFGLGDATTVTTLRIEWPSGTVQELTNVAANQILTITEPARLVPLGPREFQIRCWKGMQFEVEKSHNLQTWDSLGVVTNETGTLIFQYTQGDPQAACCFYRVASR